MGLLSSLKRKSSEPAARRLPPQDPAQVELLRTRARRRLIGVAVLVGLAVVALPYVFDATPRPARPELTVRMPGEPAEIVMREGTAAGLSPSAEAASAAALQSAVAGSAAAVAASQSPGLSATQMAMAGAGVAAVGAAAGMAVAKAPKDDIITEPRDAQAEARERERQKAAADKAAATARREVLTNSSDTRWQHLKELNAAAESLAATSALWASPVTVLARQGLGTTERTAYMQQLDGSGPVELTNAAALAVATKNRTLGAALVSIIDRMPARSRPFSAADLADKL